VNDSILLINAGTAVYRFNKKRKEFTAIKLPKSDYAFVANHSVRFAKDVKGRTFFGNLIIDWKTATAAYIKPDDIPNVFPLYDSTNPVNQMYIDSQNNAWCFTPKKTLITKFVSGKEIDYPFFSFDPHANENIIRSFYEEPGKRLWICTSAGLVYYDYAQNKFYRYRQQADNEESLSNNRATCLLKDKNGIYWIGTFGSGLCYFNLNSKFKHITLDSTLNSDKRIVYGMKTLTSGRIIINTFSNEKFQIEKDKKIRHLSRKDSITMDSMILELTGKPRQAFSEKNYWVFHEACNGQAYPGAKKFLAAVTDISLAGIAIDEQNNVWLPIVGTELISANKRIEFKQPMSHLVVAGKDHLLIATNKGLLLYNTKKYLIEATYLPQKNNPYSIGSSNVGGILPDNKGNYWITTTDAGFDFWNTKTNRFSHFTTKNGLADNTIYMILPDKHGRLWMSTNNGISCFDTATKTFTNYDESDGLINTEYNSGTGCVDDDGYFYFGGMKGIDYFHPDSFMQVKKPPPIYTSTFKVYNELQPLAQFYKLGVNDGNITIEFTTNDFLSSSKILYRYKLKGTDNGWQVLKGINAAVYNKLPPDKYHFIVQASYDAKNWSKPLVINFSVATPWFQSWWFFTLVALLTAGSIYIVFKYRLQQQLKILQIRNRIHRDLHDDVGATLSSVKAYSEILKENPDNPVIAQLIKDNAAEMIDRLEVIAWATNPHHDSFGSFIDKINHYATPACTAKKIQYNSLPDGISKEMIMPGEVRQNLYLVAKEAINNTIKYSCAANCSVNTLIHNGKFTMEIRDDGNGFNNSINGNGNGLQNMYARIKAIGGEIIINSKKGEGTEIKIQLHYPFKIPNSWDRKSNYL
jgi:signal transduction histidine kinase/sugar lactone lactonase YvrE